MRTARVTDGKLPRRIVLGALALILAAVPLGLMAVRSDEPEPKNSDVVVHEWGTFLAMNGSDGVGLEGMYHEEHALPPFVHARSRDQLRLPSSVLKGETPVIYFYTDRPQKVRVDVRFPAGLWTQWYPQAQIVGPQFAQTPRPNDLRDGRIRWCADLIPATSGRVNIPSTSSDALWNFARDVDAAYVRTPDHTKDGNVTEAERFLFYRGLGRAALPLKFSADAGGTLELASSERHTMGHLFVVRVEDGRGAYAYRHELKPGDKLDGVIPSMAGAKPMEEFTKDLADDLAARLVQSGLYPKEARAMVNTWRSSYFQTPGVRVLFVMPQRWTDEFIPLEIKPRPRQTVRVMVGRTELLLPDREKLAERAIRDLASPSSEVRQAAFDTLRREGRYAEPIVRRVLAASGDESVKATCRRLLDAEFVTDLKSALQHGARGARWLADEPAYVRAQLAVLLREIGQAKEAEAEGRAVLSLLEQKAAPAFTHAEYRGYARAQARAHEAIGDVAGTAEWYDRFLDFGSQALTKTDCRFCHRDAGPQDAAWFRTWWAGPRYAEFVAKTEGIDRALERLGPSPKSPADRLRRAYLLAGRGQAGDVESAWRMIDRTAVPSQISRADR